MPLTDIAIKSAKPQAKQYKLTDGDGMFLLVMPNGSKYWRLKYRFEGREKTLALGTYPEISLGMARERRFEARRKIQEGIDPSAYKQEAKRAAREASQNTFGAIAEEWFNLNKVKWTEDHARRLWRRLEMHLLPKLGKRPIKSIKPPELLDLIRSIEQRGTTDMSHCVHQSASVVFRHAIATGKAEFNPAASLQGSLKAHKVTHFPSITANDLPEFFKKLQAEEDINRITKIAIHLLALTFVRQGELRQARWEDIHWDAREWRIRPETTKMRTLHIVPLAQQTLDLLRELQTLTGDHRSGLLFPNQQRRINPMMSENTINHALKRMGYAGKLVGHGFRSLASTTLNELGFDGDVVERQLAHMERDGVRAAYNYAQYLPQRRDMMQRWAEFVAAQAGGNVVKMKGTG